MDWIIEKIDWIIKIGFFVHPYFKEYIWVREWSSKGNGTLLFLFFSSSNLYNNSMQVNELNDFLISLWSMM